MFVVKTGHGQQGSNLDRELERALRYHAAKYSASRRGSVLARYAKAAARLKGKELRRHACHVCAWCTLLDTDVVLKCEGKAAISPVGLLDKMLRMLRGTKRTSWGTRLSTSLQLVKRRVACLLEDSHVVCGQYFTILERVFCSLPLDAEEEIVDTLHKQNSARAFQRHIMRWHNMELQSRVEASKRWADGIQELHAKRCHPKRLAVILLQAAAALSPPRAHGVVHREDPSQTENGERSLGSADLQKLIKRTLLRALLMWNKLGLEDSTVNLAIQRVQHLILKFEEAHGQISEAASSKLWANLKLATQGASDASAAADNSAPVAGPSSLDLGSLGGRGQEDQDKRLDIRRAKVKDRAHISDSYRPGKRVRSFSTVVHRPHEPKMLRCSGCGHLMSTDWYFVHPKTSEVAILVPNNGHAVCRRGTRKSSRFTVVDGSAYKWDCPNNVDYCCHNILRHVCAPCGGLNICAHGKPRWNCSICKVQIRKRGSKRKSRELADS